MPPNLLSQLRGAGGRDALKPASGGGSAAKPAFLSQIQGGRSNLKPVPEDQKPANKTSSTPTNELEERLKLMRSQIAPSESNAKEKDESDEEDWGS